MLKIKLQSYGKFFIEQDFFLLYIVIYLYNRNNIKIKCVERRDHDGGKRDFSFDLQTAK